MIYHVEAENSCDVARLLRSCGRIVITAPPKSGRTTELLKYAEDRYPNGRFALVAPKEDHTKLIHLHWRVANGITHVDVLTKKLLGQDITGDIDVNEPMLLSPEEALVRVFNASTPTFVDGWNALSEACHKAILKRRLFIAAIA
jgi:hypothetical protein